MLAFLLHMVVLHLSCYMIYQMKCNYMMNILNDINPNLYFIRMEQTESYNACKSIECNA